MRRIRAIQPPGAPGVSCIGLDRGQVVQILDDTVDWYRTLGTQQQNATQPSDLSDPLCQPADGRQSRGFGI